MAKLLRYICSKALIEDADPITEYTIAVDVLGKTSDFKESKDANVRVEVHRLRKRLAEFYENEGASHHVRIVIPTGQYVPQFVLHEDEPVLDESDSELALEPLPATVPPEPTAAVEFAPPIHNEPPVEEPRPLVPIRYSFRPSPNRLARLAIPGLVVVAVFLGLLWVRPQDPLDSVWRPVLSSSTPILFCVGNSQGGRSSLPGVSETQLTLREFHEISRETMHVYDATTLSRFAGLLQSRGKPYRILSQTEVTFADLQNSPAVLIGLLNNDWTERLVGKLRFHVERPAPGKVLLRDRENPSNHDWLVDFNTPYLEIVRDYALVMRVVDPKTEQTVVSAAGISAFGTLAAGEFLTSSKELQKLAAIAPKGWQKMNFEIVLSTEVIRGKSGHPSIVAAHFW